MELNYFSVTPSIIFKVLKNVPEMTFFVHLSITFGDNLENMSFYALSGYKLINDDLTQHLNVKNSL